MLQYGTQTLLEIHYMLTLMTDLANCWHSLIKVISFAFGLGRSGFTKVYRRSFI
jgi:hypothetical protein